MNRSIASLVVVVALGGWYVGVYRPLDASHEDLVRSQRSVEAETETLGVELTRLERLAANEAGLRAREARFSAAIPSKPNMPQWLIEISGLAAASGVRIDALTPTPPSAAAPAAAAPAPSASTSAAPAVAPPAAGAGAQAIVPGASPQYVSTTFQVAGAYDAVQKFIEALGRGTRTVRVEGVTISSGGADSVTTSKDSKATIRAVAFVATG